MAGGVVHDINNLLQVIELCGGELRDTLPSAHAGRALADDLMSATRSASSLTAQILGFSRANVAALPCPSLAEIVNGMAAIVRRAVGARIEVITSVASDVPPVAIAPGQLEQLVLNLAVNARDAMPDGGQLTIRLGVVLELPPNATPMAPSGSPYVELSVADTGTGMAHELQKIIFEPFFTTKAEEHGTGLGLALVDRIVKQCGGCTAIDSEIGAGTTFRIFLPRVS
jgi:signal transduction histidine kinase